MITSEERLEFRELVSAEIERFIGPRTVIALVVLTVVCVVGVFMLWNKVSAQDYVIAGLKQDVVAMGLAEDFSASLDKNTAVMEALALEVGITLEGEGGASGEAD